ncbi:MAG: hypothetical protein ACR2RE_23940, partial [Geminicoccaceae bacterium]
LDGAFTNALAGIGPIGFPNFNGIGEGSVAILFDNDQSQFGFQSVGGNLGTANFDFFRRDGSLIQTLTPTNLTSNSFGFERDGGRQRYCRYLDLEHRFWWHRIRQHHLRHSGE